MEIILRRFGIGHALGSVDPKALFPDKGINVDQPDHVVKMIMGEQQMHRIISIQNFPVFTEIRHSGSRIQYEKFPPVFHHDTACLVGSGDPPSRTQDVNSHFTQFPRHRNLFQVCFLLPYISSERTFTDSRLHREPHICHCIRQLHIPYSFRCVLTSNCPVTQVSGTPMPLS